MAIFKKKKKDDVVSSDTSKMTAPKAEKKKGRAKRNAVSDMAKVLQESVPSTVQDDLQSNETFIRHLRTGNRYVALLLDVNQIGGLSKRSKKDEAKGAFIEAINSGSITAILTKDLMDRNEMVLVPNMSTLTNMLDFSMLTKLTYPFVYVKVDPNVNLIEVEPAGADIAFEDLVDRIVDNEETIDDLLSDDDDDGGDDSLFTYDDDVESNDGLEEVNTYTDNMQAVDDDIDDIDDIDDMDSFRDEVEGINDLSGLTDMETGYSYDDDIPEDFSDDIPSYNDAPLPENDEYIESQDDSQYVDANESGVQEEDEVPEEWMQTILHRKFYSDDLGLEITTEPFDVQFLQTNGFIPFEENRPDGWLNNQLNEMAREANFEMEKMHQQNLFLMRERYFKLISRHCDRIVKDLDTTDPNTQYGMIAASLLQARNNEQASVEMRVAKKKEDLEASWKRKLQEVGQDAARSAQRQYRERYGSQHEADLYNLDNEIRSSIEDDYQDAIHEMNNRRRMEASKLLDLGISEVLEEISDMYVGALEDENARYQELQENMNAFLDDNRRYDIAQANALAEELRQNDKADAVLREQTVKMENLNAEFAARKASLEQDIERLQRENADRIRDLNNRHDEDIEVERERNRQLQQRIDELHEQNIAMHDTVAKEFDSRITEKDHEILNMRDRLEDVIYQQKHANLITTYLVIAITIAALAIGFVGGSFINLHKQTTQVQQQLIDEYNQSKDLESDSESEPESKPNTKTDESSTTQ
jgi:hypothetical protein